MLLLQVRIEVLEPQSLRQKVIEMAQSVIAFYSQPTRTGAANK